MAVLQRRRRVEPPDHTVNRQAIAVSPLVKRQLAQRLRQIDGQIEAIDRRLKTLRNTDSDLCQRFE